MLRQQESLAMGAQTGKCVFAPLQEPLKQWLPPEKEKKKQQHLFTLSIIHIETHKRKSDRTLCAIVILPGVSKKNVPSRKQGWR